MDLNKYLELENLALLATGPGLFKIIWYPNGDDHDYAFEVFTEGFSEFCMDLDFIGQCWLWERRS